MHAVNDHCRFDQIASMFREELADARFADAVTGPADALQAARHGARRFDLDHEIDRTHVDAEFERAGGNQASQPAGLEFVFDEEAALAETANRDAP